MLYAAKKLSLIRQKIYTLREKMSKKNKNYLFGGY